MFTKYNARLISGKITEDSNSVDLQEGKPAVGMEGQMESGVFTLSTCFCTSEIFTTGMRCYTNPQKGKAEGLEGWEAGSEDGRQEGKKQEKKEEKEGRRGGKEAGRERGKQDKKQFVRSRTTLKNKSKKVSNDCNAKTDLSPLEIQTFLQQKITTEYWFFPIASQSQNLRFPREPVLIPRPQL